MPSSVDLTLAAKPAPYWRIVDPNNGVHGSLFDRLRQSILIRHEFTCAGCGFISVSAPHNESGSLEVHHLDHNHSNSIASNLAAICPLCHTITHVGLLMNMDEREPQGWIASMPGITQVQMIHLTRTLGVARLLEVKPYAAMADTVWRMLQERFAETLPVLNGFTGDVRLFSSWLQTGSQRLVNDFARQFPEMIFLPNVDRFEEPMTFWAHEVYAKRIPPATWATLMGKLIETLERPQLQIPAHKIRRTQ